MPDCSCNGHEFKVKKRFHVTMLEGCVRAALNAVHIVKVNILKYYKS